MEGTYCVALGSANVLPLARCSVHTAYPSQACLEGTFPEVLGSANQPPWQPTHPGLLKRHLHHGSRFSRPATASRSWPSLRLLPHQDAFGQRLTDTGTPCPTAHPQAPRLTPSCIPAASQSSEGGFSARCQSGEHQSPSTLATAPWPSQAPRTNHQAASLSACLSHLLSHEWNLSVWL